MRTLSLRLPNSLHRFIKEVAKEEGVSINQLLTNAAAEKVSVLRTVQYLEKRAGRSAALSSRLPMPHPCPSRPLHAHRHKAGGPFQPSALSIVPPGGGRR